MKRRLIATLMALCMTLTLVPATAWATEPDEVGAPPKIAVSAPTEATEPVPEPTPEPAPEPTPEPELASEPTAQAAEVASGYCGAEGDGTNLTWTLDNTGTLTISGTGRMQSSYYNPIPWENQRETIQAVEIAKGVTSIGRSAFYGCSSLESVSIPAGVTSIGEYAFADCSGLTSVNIPSSVISIGYSVFEGCSGLTSISIPNSITSISEFVFQGCSSLESVSIPSSVTSVGDGAFSGCSSLESVSIPSSITSISEFVFQGCSSLTSVSIPSSITSIGDGAFSGCSGLTSVSISSSITKIGDCAFQNCSGLKDVYYAGIQEEWKNIKFNSGNDSLKRANVHYYKVFNGSAATWEEAEAFCKSQGGHLATLTCQAENDCAYQVMTDAGYTSAYFGLTDKALEGNWLWITGEPLTYTNWHSGEANQENENEDYGMFYYKYNDGTWNDGDFGNATVNGGVAFICEWESHELHYSKWQYFTFANIESDFFKSDERKNYNAGSYFNHFNEALEQLYPGYKNSIKRMGIHGLISISQPLPWGGSCYGFAAIEGMVNTGLLPVSAIDSNASDLPSVDKPCNNTAVRNLLNYYYLAQDIPALRSKKYTFNSEGKNALLDMASDVVDGTPYMLTYHSKIIGGVHSIVLDGGQLSPDDGSYKLIGQDNRFHGYTVCKNQDGSWVDTGIPVTVDVKIPADGSSCTVSLSSNTYMRDNIAYGSEVNEKVRSFEFVSTFDQFASISPTNRMARNSIQTLAETDEDNSIIYYNPNPNNVQSRDATNAFVLEDKSGHNLVASSDLQDITGNALKDYWYTGQSTMEASDTLGENGVIILTPKYTPVGLMAELTTSASEQDQYTVEGLAGGTISYVGSDGFASVSAEKADSVLLDTSNSNGTVTLNGNAGDFKVSVANADNTVATVEGSSTDTVVVTPTDTGINLKAAVGEYKVTFTDTESNNPETPQTIKITNNNKGVDVEDNSGNPVVCGKYEGKCTAEIKWDNNHSQYTLSLKLNEGADIPDFDKFTVWQAEYDGDKLSDVKLLSDQTQPTKTVTWSISTGKKCKLFVLDKDSIPVIRAYELN